MAKASKSKSSGSWKFYGTVAAVILLGMAFPYVVGPLLLIGYFVWMFVEVRRDLRRQHQSNLTTVRDWHDPGGA